MNAFSNLRISGKLSVAFAAIIVIMLAVSGVTVWQVFFIEDANRQTAHTYEVLDTANELQEAILDQESSVRGYLISGDPAYLAPYRTSEQRYEEKLARLRELIAGDPAHTARLNTMEQIYREWRQTVISREIKLMQHMDTVEEARALAASGIGKQYTTRLRELDHQFQQVELTVLADRQANQAAAFRTTYMVSAAGTVLALIVAILLAMLLTRSIASPIGAMTQAMTRLASGDKSVAIPAVGRRDEVGSMAESVQVFKDNMIRNEELAAAAARQQQERNARAARVEELTDRFRNAVQTLLQTVSHSASDMQATAHSMSETASRTTERATAVAAAAEEASQNVNAVSAAAEELAQSIAEISRQVLQSSELAATASREAEETNQVVSELAEAATRIGEVVSLINDIAEQTNLLALNATIEAARAGDAGKGFAVVASEVKNLANQTAKATEDIAGQIGAIQTTTGSAVEAIRRIAGRITDINGIAAMVAAAVEEQQAATAEIARNVEQAAAGANEVSANIGEVSSAAQMTGNSAGMVLTSSTDLGHKADALKDQIETFLTDVKAA
ncbi:methyl-accepting chemotaxis protein [Oceanibaculum pacificum]|uniref:Chemotaxis protein n=1 Tax=Oceanibaculum pacificum TaxID=580166 RepID=A0A154W3K7_9PROT|nr:CHASE3 domain-containing protein [Oceanibaculum pacificum]KZD08155.1 hypothetical protein AUP43_09095 [Oceanibaculum pacificum]